MSNSAEISPAAAFDVDAPLVAAARAGDLQAFESLVLRHQKRMLNIAFRIIGEYDDACEVTQDAFVSAWRNLGAFRQEARFSTWLTSITVNLSKNRRKRVTLQQARTPRSLDAPVRTDDGEVLPDPPSGEPTALDRMERQDVKNRVQDCIRALEPDFREVIVLRDMQDLAYEEIATALKLAIGTVKSRLSRAREAVKECLKKTMGDRS
ncbi:MAG: sigma-70 family RNA polymerase sigma factor [Nitrospiraceae bacterium]|nr:sigma-70 family RNA polymerase sigma factor [Nitrospiraceae bacterium]